MQRPDDRRPTAELDLELVPTAAEGNTPVLLFYGVPLAKTELTVIGPPKWEKHLTTDEQGRIAMPTPGLAATFWKLPISKRNRVAPGMTSSIAPATLHHSRSCSGTGRRGPPNA